MIVLIVPLLLQNYHSTRQLHPEKNIIWRYSKVFFSDFSKQIVGTDRGYYNIKYGKKKLKC